MPEAGANHLPLRVLVADEDRRCRGKVRALLAAETNVEVVGECRQADELETALRMHKPDLLLLEPRIPGGNVFDLLASLSEASLPLVIFASAQDQYAMKAFETKAFDFVMKPYDRTRLHSSIERVKADVAKRRIDDLKMPESEQSRQPKPAREERLMVKTGGRIVFLAFHQVDWVEAAANYISIHTEQEVYRVRQPIGQFEKGVAGRNFSRIHRSFIVNVAKIVEVQPCNSGEYMVRLKSGKELPCSRNYNSAIRTLVQIFPSGRPVE